MTHADRRSPSRYLYPANSEKYRHISDIFNLFSDAVEAYNSEIRSANAVTLNEIDTNQPEDCYEFAFTTKSIPSMSGFLFYFREKLRRPDLDLSSATSVNAKSSSTQYYFKLPRRRQQRSQSNAKFIVLLLLLALIVLAPVFYFHQ